MVDDESEIFFALPGKARSAGLFPSPLSRWLVGSEKPVVRYLCEDYRLRTQISDSLVQSSANEHGSHLVSLVLPCMVRGAVGTLSGLESTLSLLVLRSLNPVTKETAITAVILGRTSPDPGLGSPVELRGGDTHGLLNLSGIGKALSSQGITAKKAPPPFLQIEPARSCGNEDVLETWMVRKPRAGL